MSEIPRDWKAVRGSTYVVSTKWEDLGALWDCETGYWYVAPDRLREAKALVEEALGRKR